MVALGGAVAVPYSGMGNGCLGGMLQENIPLSIPLHLSAISAPPTSVILSFCCQDSKNFFAVPISTHPPAPTPVLLFSVPISLEAVVWIALAESPLWL